MVNERKQDLIIDRMVVHLYVDFHDTNRIISHYYFVDVYLRDKLQT